MSSCPTCSAHGHSNKQVGHRGKCFGTIQIPRDMQPAKEGTRHGERANRIERTKMPANQDCISSDATTDLLWSVLSNNHGLLLRILSMSPAHQTPARHACPDRPLLRDLHMHNAKYFEPCLVPEAYARPIASSVNLPS